MSEPRRPGELPPELPPEYVEAYRRGYERAYARGDVPPAAEPEPTVQSEPVVETRIRGPLFADETADDAAGAAGVRPSRRPSHLADPPAATISPLLDLDDGSDPEPPHAAHRAEVTPPPPMFAEERPSAPRPPWLVPAVLAGLVVLLLLAAYGLGRIFSSSVSDSSAQPTGPASVVIPSGDGGSGTANPPRGRTYRGPTETAAISGATGTCEAAPSVDSAGNPVRYDVSNVYDGDLTTAWRCDGDGVGEKLTLQLPSRTRIGQVGLVPGYAKTDPSSGVDRYAENDRITKVRWRLGNGTVVEQRFDPSPSLRSIQSKRIPVVRTDRVVVEILSSTPGARNTIAISEVRLGHPR